MVIYIQPTIYSFLLNERFVLQIASSLVINNPNRATNICLHMQGLSLLPLLFTKTSTPDATLSSNKRNHKFSCFASSKGQRR